MTSSEPILAFSTGLPAGLPTDIQWMPPGRHAIRAMRGGEPVELTVQVSEHTAKTMQRLLDSIRARADAGVEDRPYIDFNHEDREAAGHITAFYWAGEDPRSGGVRARVEWSAPGRAALEGRAFRRFSPSFFVDAGGEVTGAPINMGGLVNQAAFKQIQPIWSRDGGAQVTNHKDPTMDPKDKELADLRAAVAERDTKLAEVNARLANAESEQTVKARNEEIASLKTTITGLEAQIATHKKDKAKAAVEAAIKAGKLPPQNTALHTKWVESLEQDPTRIELLEALPVQAVSGTIIPLGNGGTQTQAAAGTPAHQFVSAVQAKFAEVKNKEAALRHVIATQPDLYKAWRESNGAIPLNLN